MSADIVVNLIISFAVKLIFYITCSKKVAVCYFKNIITDNLLNTSLNKCITSWFSINSCTCLIPLSEIVTIMRDYLYTTAPLIWTNWNRSQFGILNIMIKRLIFSFMYSIVLLLITRHPFTVTLQSKLIVVLYRLILRYPRLSLWLWPSRQNLSVCILYMSVQSITVLVLFHIVLVVVIFVSHGVSKS